MSKHPLFSLNKFLNSVPITLTQQDNENPEAFPNLFSDWVSLYGKMSSVPSKSQLMSLIFNLDQCCMKEYRQTSHFSKRIVENSTSKGRS